MTIPASPLSLPRRLREGRLCRGGGRGLSRLLALSVVAFLLSAFGCATPTGDRSKGIDPWPAYSPSGEERATRRSGLWPFVAVEETPSWRQFSLRPFYVERETPDGSEKKVQFLWPIYLYRRSDEDITIRVLPLYTYRKDVYAYKDEREIDTEYMLFPFLFGGKSTEYGGHFAVFPVAGSLKNFLGRDEIRFFLFPLYMEYSKDELHQRNYVWPVLSFSEGGDYDGFRLWPLFGHFEKRGEYRKEFFLWPIVHHQTFDLDKEESGERLLVFPFYAREDSSRRRYRSIIWPFFSHEQNYAKNFDERAMPWPFIVRARGENIYKTRFWPLYGYTRTEGSEKRFVLWPFYYRNTITLDDDLTRYETLLLPFLSSKTEVSEEQGVVKHRFRFWPLWRFRRFEDGSTYLRMLSLLWFDDEQGFERQYSPLWTIYERGTSPDGSGHTYALWRLFRQRHTATGSEAHIPLLFSHIEDMEQDSEETRILGGLLGTSREGDERRLRLLFFLDIPY